MPYFISFGFYLLGANMVFLRNLKRKAQFGGRFCICSLTGFALIYFLNQNSNTLLKSSAMFLLIYLFTVYAAKICFQITWIDSVFCTLAGYNSQHIASVLRRCLNEVIKIQGLSVPYVTNILLKLLITALFYLCCYFILGKKITATQELVQRKKLLPIVVIVVIVEIILFDVVVLHMVQEPNYDWVYIAVICAMNIMYGLSILIIQFNLLLQRSLENELDIVNQMLNKERQQYQISKDTIDLINRKCHDMKHQIHQIGKTHIAPETLQEMENTIVLYDSMLKTNSQALDIILAEKLFLCQSNSIELTCIADGAILSFMNDSDVYALFGNMLDNAIQAVLLMDADSRVIGLTVKEDAGFVSISSYNYYCGEVIMQQGLPITSKADKDYHGFGTRSMAVIVEKYNGTIAFHTDNGMFRVNILIPLNY